MSYKLHFEFRADSLSGDSDTAAVEATWVKGNGSRVILGTFVSAPATGDGDAPWTVVDIPDALSVLSGRIEISRVSDVHDVGFSGLVGWTKYDLFNISPNPAFTYGLVDGRLRSLGPTDTFESSGIYADIGSTWCDVSFTYYRGASCRLRFFFAMDPTTGIGYCYMPWRSGAATITRYHYRGEIKQYYEGFGTPQGEPPSGTLIRVTHNGSGTITVYWDGVLMQTAVDPEAEATPAIGNHIGFNVGLYTSNNEEIVGDFQVVGGPDNAHIRNVWVGTSVTLPNIIASDNRWYHYNFSERLLETQPGPVWRTTPEWSARVNTNTGAATARLSIPFQVGHQYLIRVWAKGIEGDGSTTRMIDLEVQDGLGTQHILIESSPFYADDWRLLSAIYDCTIANGSVLMQAHAGIYLPGGWHYDISDWEIIDLGVEDAVVIDEQIFTKNYGSYPQGFPYTADVQDGMLGSELILNDGGTLPDSAYYAECGAGDYLIRDSFNRSDGTSDLPFRDEGGTWQLSKDTGDTDRWTISNGKVLRTNGGFYVINGSGQEWLTWIKGEYGDISQIVIKVGLYSPWPFSGLWVSWGCSEPNMADDGFSVHLKQYEQFTQVYGPGGVTLYNTSFTIHNWETADTSTVHPLTITYDRATTYVKVDFEGQIIYEANTGLTASGSWLGLGADTPNGFDYISVQGVGVEIPFGHQFSMNTLTVVEQDPLTWYFGPLVSPPLRQRSRDDGLAVDSRQEKSQGSSQQSSLRRGGRVYY